ncbi:papain fold toxin domain-containing protein [Fortiea sp. LEGE XX443]|nr:papain fold toxin domain-containing protein [Fortiea sp. LEGE XX443]
MSAIASSFKIFECVLCAITLRQFLIEQNIPGKKISLSLLCHYRGSIRM